MKQKETNKALEIGLRILKTPYHLAFGCAFMAIAAVAGLFEAIMIK